MGFWIFMLIMANLSSVMMISFGLLFKKRAPKEINFLFGYRTSRSMKSNESWEFAHRLLGKIWVVTGVVCLLLSTAAMLFFLGKDKDSVGTAGAIICFVNMAILIITIFPVERALKKKFGE